MATPRLSPRPAPLPWSTALWRLTRDTTRISVLTTALAVATYASVFVPLRALLPDARTAFVVFGVTVHEMMYYGLNGTFMLFDKWGWFSQYKLERKPHQVPPPALIAKTLKQSAFSHFVFQPVALYFLFALFATFGYSDGPLPSWWTMVWQIGVSAFINDTIFYWCHRALHTPVLYRLVHKQHHEYIGTVGWAAEYAHPLEAVIGNQVPALLGPIVTGMHLWVFVWFLAWRLWRTYETHSGYCFAGSLLSRIGLLNGFNSVFHDFHHTRNMGNFGGTCWWDHVCGTQDYFLAQFGDSEEVETRRKQEEPLAEHMMTSKL